MQRFIESCEKQSTMHRQMNEATDDERASTGTLKEAGAFGQPGIHMESEGSTHQPRTSTPKKNTFNPPTPTIQRHTGSKRASGDGPLPEEGASAWPTQEGLEEEAELCLPEIQPHPEDEVGAEGQDEVHSEAGDLLEEDDPAPQLPSSNGEIMSSLNEVMSSVNWVTDAAIGNTEGIQKLKEGHSRNCVRAGLQHSKSMDAIESMKNQILVLTQNDHKKDERIKSLEADREVADKGVETWQIPFSNLKRKGKDSISSKIIHTPSGGCFKAKLFLNEVSKHGSPCLSIVVSETSVSSAAASADKALKYKCRLQLVNLKNVADSIQEEHELQRGVCGAASGKNEAKFLDWVTIKLIEDQSRGFLMNGVLLVILTFEKI
ncbi:uncharacterized protein LOC115925487 [Strongylocentrotus purpuratus]|uniref:Uncharacterized protein n=1 Tax=Strongylocentrotus purpuratus TaxID=7668 RepID=A0A7M7T0R2_STRPU|nr:uncharacterized protein LOC115925487 [Strongylocentrotus purpuratus]